MQTKFKTAVVLMLVVIVILLSSCDTPDKQSASINVALIDDIVSLDSAGTKDTMSETLARCIYATLYIFDEEMNLQPLLAEKAERISELEWVFSIKENAKFHDGSPLTAGDVKFSLDRARSIELAEKSLQLIDQVEVIDTYKVKIRTIDPSANLPSLLVRVSTSIMSEKAMKDTAYDFNKPVGSGPFRVLERIESKQIRLERYDDYFLDPAKTQFLNFIIEPSEQNSTAALLNGSIDVLFRVSANDGNYLKFNEEVRVYQVDSTKMELLMLNPQYEPLQNIAVRQAIACAIDKQNIIDNVLDGYGHVQSSMIPAPLLGFKDYSDYSYDPERARRLLTEAGYADGFDITVLTFDAQRKKLMEYLKLDLAKVNIRLNYEFLELEEYLKVVEKKDHMATILSWTSNADPDSTFTQLYSKDGHVTVNQSGFTDSKVEELLRMGRMESDSDKRDAIYKEVNDIIAASYHVIPLYQPSALVAARNEISGVRINPQGIFAYENLSRIAD